MRTPQAIGGESTSRHPFARLSGAPMLLKTLPVLAVALLGGPRSMLAQETRADTRLLEAIDAYTGVAGRVDDIAARQLLERVAAEGEDVLATMWMARVYSTGRMTFPRDETRAREIAGEVISDIRDLAADGDIEAIFLMGTAYDEALGVTRDWPEAMRWYRLAAGAGHILATHNVGNMYRDGRGVPTDPEIAAMWWLRAARAGDVIPALRLGEAYEAGNGVPLDLDVASTWYAKAAAAGNATAADALSRLSGR